MEWVKECAMKCLEFKEVDYESNDELMFTVEEVGNMKKEIKILGEEGFSLCTREVVRKGEH